MNSDNRPNHIGFVDGIRGYSALWVMFGHFSTRTGCWIPVLQSPGKAVDLFMVVSGFLMTYHHLLRRRSEPLPAVTNWGRFYVRRIFRIAPLYFPVLLFCFLSLGYYAIAQQHALKSLVGVNAPP